ncbi:MAG: helix-turn-helix domain-containing protein [Actinobacteria bacterium]|nr:helix-turn-helix domain-containing protein [Actinomycetota bacterium]
MSVGNSLREIRKASGYSVAELSVRTRIPESVIEDFEHDDFSSCGGTAYARGHIRNIASICGVSADEVLIKFESQTISLNKSIRELLNENNATLSRPVKKNFSWKALAGVAAGIFIFAIVGGVIITSSNTPNSPITVTGQIETGSVATRVKGVTVKLKGVNGLSWVAVSDSSGATLFSGRIREGEEQSFQDDQLIYLVLGNAGALELIVNGENLGTVGAVGEVVRLEFGPQALLQNG